MLKEFTVDNFQSEVLDYQGKCFVKFSSPTCGPCRMMEPVMKEAAAKWSNINFGEVNVAKNQALARKYDIMAVPTLMMFDKGEIKAQFTGYMDIDDLEEYFGAYFND